VAFPGDIYHKRNFKFVVKCCLYVSNQNTGDEWKLVTEQPPQQQVLKCKTKQQQQQQQQQQQTTSQQTPFICDTRYPSRWTPTIGSNAMSQPLTVDLEDGDSMYFSKFTQCQNPKDHTQNAYPL
jgi:hypothetical protein